MVETLAIAGMITVIFAIRELTSIYRERTWNAYRDELVKAHRVKETEMLNRLMSTSLQDYMALNAQAVEAERESFPTTRSKAQDTPSDVIDDLYSNALGNGFSKDGVAVV